MPKLNPQEILFFLEIKSRYFSKTRSKSLGFICMFYLLACKTRYKIPNSSSDFSNVLNVLYYVKANNMEINMQQKILV